MRVHVVPYISVRKRRARIAMLDAISFSIGFRFLSFVFPGLNFCHSSIPVPTYLGLSVSGETHHPLAR